MAMKPNYRFPQMSNSESLTDLSSFHLSGNLLFRVHWHLFSFLLDSLRHPTPGRSCSTQRPQGFFGVFYGPYIMIVICFRNVLSLTCRIGCAFDTCAAGLACQKFKARATFETHRPFMDRFAGSTGWCMAYTFHCRDMDKHENNHCRRP
jgi:hypothetical protein